MALGFETPTKKVGLVQPDLGTLKTPTTRTVTSDETVLGQMGKVLDSGSPLLTRARTGAAQTANRRGLLNSSMGVQAGEEAALSAALPIAQQDAQTFARQALTNQDLTNRFDEARNEYTYGSGISSQDYGQKYQLAEKDLAFRKDLSSQEHSQDKALSAQEATQMESAIGKEYGYKEDIIKLQEAAAKERANITAETARLGTEGGLSKEVLGDITDLETSYLDDWVEVNKMVFDPEDVGNDSKLRQEAVDKLKKEYDGRRSIIKDLHSTAKAWDWGVA